MTQADLVAAMRAIHEIHMTTLDRLEETLAAHRLTWPTAQALWVIEPAEPAPSMKILAERLHCNAPNLTFIANQLVDRGLAERSVDPADRRGRVLALTEDGRRVRGEIIAAAVAASPLSSGTPGALQQLAKLLGEIAPS